MKFLKFVLINILSVYSLVSGEVSNDCTQLSAFLKEKKEWDVMGVWVILYNII